MSPIARARVLPRAAGLPDDWFEHDGQITKREIRAMTLSQLAPRRGEFLWDVGSGSGSVAIEWMLADPANNAVAIELRHDRAERIARNALSFGVPGLSVVTGEAPHAFADLPTPDAIFIGGGASAPGMIERAYERARVRRAAGRQCGDAGDAGRRVSTGARAGAGSLRRSRSRMPSRSGAIPAGARRCRSCNGGSSSHEPYRRHRRRMPRRRCGRDDRGARAARA